MLLEAFIVGKSTKFWILIQKMLELIGMTVSFGENPSFVFPSTSCLLF